MPVYVPSGAFTNLTRAGGRPSSFCVHHSPRIDSGGGFTARASASPETDGRDDANAGALTARATRVAAIATVRPGLWSRLAIEGRIMTERRPSARARGGAFRCK